MLKLFGELQLQKNNRDYERPEDNGFLTPGTYLSS
jgi:hypothetical protein